MTARAGGFRLLAIRPIGLYCLRMSERRLSLLTERERGLKSWNKFKEENESRDVDRLYRDMMAKITSCSYAAVKDLQMILDSCTVPSQLELVENAVKHYRASKSMPYDGLPSVLIRTCCRLGRPDKALEMVMDKVTYGVFPVTSAYNILIDGLIRSQDELENACELALKTYRLMSDDERDARPNNTTVALAIIACIRQGSKENLMRGLQLYQEHLQRGLRSHHIIKIRKEIINAALKHQMPEVAKDILAHYTSEPDYEPTNEFLHFQMKVLAATGEESKMIDDLVMQLERNPTLGVFSDTFSLIEETITELKDEEQIQKLHALKNRLISENRITSPDSDS